MTRTFTDPSDTPAPPEEVRIPLQAIRGRGAATAMAHRFARDAREVVDDGWTHSPWQEDDGADGAQPAPALATRVHLETARSAICANDSPDIFFELSVNPYRGCEHGCVYCYAQAHAQLSQLFAGTRL